MVSCGFGSGTKRRTLETDGRIFKMTESLALICGVTLMLTPTDTVLGVVSKLVTVLVWDWDVCDLTWK